MLCIYDNVVSYHVCDMYFTGFICESGFVLSMFSANYRYSQKFPYMYVIENQNIGKSDYIFSLAKIDLKEKIQCILEKSILRNVSNQNR